MAPDINTLPPSRASSSSPSQPRVNDGFRHDASTPSPTSRSPSVSLAAAAALNNAQIQSSQEPRRSSASSPRGRGAGATPGNITVSGAGPSPSLSGRQQERRRSSAMMSLSLNDPAVPAPGEMQTSSYRAASPLNISGSPTASGPRRQRAPSLGELHQELEAEQEAQNRLLQMIRQQQLQLQALQQQSGQNQGAIDDSTPTSERSLSFPPLPPQQPSSGLPSSAHPRPPGLSRQSSHRSRRSSRGHASPALRPTSNPPDHHQHGHRRSTDFGAAAGGTWGSLSSSGLPAASGRDETAFYQAETQTLTRENQMLKMRIRELERQILDLNTSTTAGTGSPTASQSQPASLA